jgi:hypothetical protein
MVLAHDPILTQFTTTPVRLDDYVKRREWLELPLRIKIAVVHLWCAEHDEFLLMEECTGDANSAED